MDIVLVDGEIRTLGCLIEKELTTPEYYPLSLNALTNACNQKSNRSPVVSYDEADVAQKLDSLQRKGLAGKMLAPGSRVPKYLHAVLDRFDLSRQELAVLCELMLRGPQTAGEIRSRAERMAAFENLEETERVLQSLTEHDPPLAARLPREPGRKEHRFMHLFTGGSGEEFVVLSPNTTRENGLRAAERVRKAIANHSFAGMPDKKVTVSIGVAGIPDPGIDNRDKMLHAADLAMYSAKKNGRNRVESA